MKVKRLVEVIIEAPSRIMLHGPDEDVCSTLTIVADLTDATIGDDRQLFKQRLIAALNDVCPVASTKRSHA